MKESFQIEYSGTGGIMKRIGFAAVILVVMLFGCGGGGEPAPPAADGTSPTCPTGLTAKLVSANQINLAWNASMDNVGVVGYKLYRDGNYLKDSQEASISDAGLTFSTTYCYKVSAYDAAGNLSSESSEVCKTTLTPARVHPPF